MHLQISGTTPLMLRRVEKIPEVGTLRATSQHDHTPTQWVEHTTHNSGRGPDPDQVRHNDSD